MGKQLVREINVVHAQSEQSVYQPVVYGGIYASPPAVAALEAKADALQADVDALASQASVDALEAKTDALQADIDALGTAGGDLAGAVAALEAKLDEEMVVTQDSLARGQGGVIFRGARPAGN